MGWQYRAPAKKMRLALLPALLSLAWPAAGAWAQTCSLSLLNSVPLTVADDIAWVPASVGTQAREFQIDTAAPDNQMGKDAMRDFGLSAIDFTPAHDDGGAGGFALTQGAGTNVDGRTFGLNSYGPIGGGTGGNGIAITNARGVVFHSWATAGTFTLGSMRTDHLQFVVTDIPQPGSGGILSAAFFKRYDIDLNFGAHKFNMFAPTHCKGQVQYWRAPAVASLPFRFKDGRIIVRVTLDGREMDAALDTGSQRTEMKFDDADSLFYRNAKSSGVTRTDDGLLANNFTVLAFGDTVLIRNPHVVLTHSGLAPGAERQTGTLIHNLGPTATQPALTIGTDLLKLLHLYIAFDERMVYVTQSQELPQGDARALPVVAVTPFRP
ncbi:MAG TPA: hypothetical protein VFI23_10580 [Rhizomicrobium sp.]|nr:hypothetical protein [Rhizomicrobium sp.]